MASTDASVGRRDWICRASALMLMSSLDKQFEIAGSLSSSFTTDSEIFVIRTHNVSLLIIIAQVCHKSFEGPVDEKHG